MGLAEWWSNRVFDVVDFFTTSHVEGMRDNYKNLVNYLNNKLPRLNEQIVQMEDSFRALTTAMEGSGDGISSGGLVDAYDSKFAIYKTETQAIIDYYRGMRDSAVAKQTEAQLQLDIYEELVRQENARRAEIARQEAEAAAAAARRTR